METEQIKNNIKISELAQSLGIQVKNGKSVCLWHSEKTPSLSFNDELGIFKCFGCDKSGDVITLYQEVKGVDFKTAVEALGGIETKQEPMKIKKDNSKLYNKFIDFLGGRDEKTNKYLLERGITQEIADKFKISTITDVPKTIEFLKSIGAEEGFFSKGHFIFSENRIILPVFVEEKIVTIRGRVFGESDRKYISLVGEPLPMFNQEALKKDEIYITEGEFDAMMLIEMGHNACAIFGTNNFKDEFVKHFNDKDIVLAFDNDDPGKDAVVNVSKKLEGVANSIYSIIIPDGYKDITDCYLAGLDPTSFKRKEIKDGVKIVHLEDASLAEGSGAEKIQMGFQMLDDAMGGGITKGSSVVVAALSGEGKTAFMQTISYHYAKQNYLCLWFSYEESISAIWGRFKDMGLTKENLMYCPIKVEDNRIDYIEKVIKRQKKTKEFFIVFIDQLSFLSPKITGGMDKNMQLNYSLYLGNISQQLKDIAMANGIIIVFAHQLGKSGELEYSNKILSAPDKVIFLKREEASDAMKEALKDDFTDKTIVKMRKNRPLGTRPIMSMTVENGIFVPYKEFQEERKSIKGNNPLDIFK